MPPSAHAHSSASPARCATRSRHALPALLLSLCGAALAQPVLQPGLWEKHFDGGTLDPDSGAYRSMSVEQRQDCLSEASLKQGPDMDAATFMQRNRQQGSSCRLLSEQRGATASTWAVACQDSDGTRREVRHESASAPTTFSSVTLATDVPAGDASRTVRSRIQIRMTRLGDCTPATRP
ncbi:DUF3617 domain-containing protein [Azohydromonas caseinilytica]|uniref:DUF3617 family protein n=1 Tax=Azohydromonas caseinilytica TaxID=2728836 RepID=A0A848FCQ5_9BURK|nr:DUF3617 family protein [Azohydromonas caseinilytica]NML15950.1 DUF3617 family protein [Azohydromonas caseinilytica]